MGGGIEGLATAMDIGKASQGERPRLGKGDDLVPTDSGVRAQALMPDGKLVDDFLIVTGKNSIHVCNAPSPAATASLEIGCSIANQLPKVTLARR
jgi:L-2-hydroxyglutarate oxidase LhgO